MTSLQTKAERRVASEAIEQYYLHPARARVRLSTRDYAEKYVRLPRTSPFGNVPFRVDRQPYVGLLFDEMDSGGWKTFLVSGPSQSGKTLSAFVIPTIRDLHELQLNTIVGFPEADMASDKWDTDFRPTLEASPELKWLMPTSGPGSRGGRIRDRVTLQNGVDMKIMTRGGQDTGKAGFTSPRVRVTEAAGWSKRTETSSEANALRQLRARMKAFSRKDPRRCLFVEGTLTTKAELPWSGRGEDDDERFISTRSQILSDCPHCGAWISPGREHLVGWQNAESEDEAANEAVWLCPVCLAPIDADQRRASVANCRLVHGGQSVNEHGEVVGPKPPTSTLWFHWQAWHNLLRDPADFAVAEWEAAQIELGTEDRENAEMELCQFDFSVPFVSTLVDQSPLDAKKVRGRGHEWPRNVVPADTQNLVVGVDAGKWRLHWVVLALRTGGQVHVVAYGTWDVCSSDSDNVENRIRAAIAEFDEQVVRPGFLVEGSGEYWIPDIVVGDERYYPDEMAAAIRAINQKGWQARWRLAMGHGRSTARNRSGFTMPKKPTREKPWIGTQWYAGMNFKRRIPEISFNADFWKLWIQERLRVKMGRKGSLTLFAVQNQNEHGKFSNHLVSEQLKRWWDPVKGLVEEWEKKGQNHWLDACAMAAIGGDILGWRLGEIEGDEEPEVEAEAVEAGDDDWFARMLGDV